MIFARLAPHGVTGLRRRVDVFAGATIGGTSPEGVGVDHGGGVFKDLGPDARQPTGLAAKVVEALQSRGVIA